MQLPEKVQVCHIISLFFIYFIDPYTRQPLMQIVSRTIYYTVFGDCCGASTTDTRSSKYPNCGSLNTFTRGHTKVV